MVDWTDYRLVHKKCPMFEYPSFVLCTHQQRAADALYNFSSLSFARPCEALLNSGMNLIRQINVTVIEYVS